MKHLKNLWYILRHKYFVLRVGLELGVPILQLLIHDLSKLLPSEFFAYSDMFFAGDPRERKMHEPGIRLQRECLMISVEVDRENKLHRRFDEAWLHHLNHNKHHFQYWCCIRKDGSIFPLEMPERFAREMTADWIAAGRAQGQRGRFIVQEWYEMNKDCVVLHPKTQKFVEYLVYRYASGLDCRSSAEWHDV